MKNIVKKYFCFLFSMILFFNIYGEIKYKVSGKVIREEKGIKGVDVWVYPALSIESITLSVNTEEQRCITDKNGQFTFYLKPGRYNLDYSTENLHDSELDSIEPMEINIVDKNIKNLIVKLYTTEEIIKANLSILENIPDTKPTVQYKWGRIPIHSISECRSVAEEEFANFKDESEVLIGAKIGDPVTFYDLKNNPGDYQFPILNMGVEVGYIGVDALQLTPVVNGYGYLEITLNELKASLNALKGQKGTFDRYVPQAIEKVAKKKGCNKDDIALMKLLCLTAINGGNLYAMLRITPTNETVIVNLYSFEILTDQFTLDEIQEYTEDGTICNYIKQVKKTKNIPLM